MYTCATAQLGHLFGHADEVVVAAAPGEGLQVRAGEDPARRVVRAVEDDAPAAPGITDAVVPDAIIDHYMCVG